MILLELDPNIVKPGWTPLLITIGIALVMVLLFRSMRRQFRRVDENFPEPLAPVGVEPADEPVADDVDDAVLDPDPTGPGRAETPGAGNR
jgi:hypothetical protein